MIFLGSACNPCCTDPPNNDIEWHYIFDCYGYEYSANSSDGTQAETQWLDHNGGNFVGAYCIGNTTNPPVHLCLYEWEPSCGAGSPTEGQKTYDYIYDALAANTPPSATNFANWNGGVGGICGKFSLNGLSRSIRTTATTECHPCVEDCSADSKTAMDGRFFDPDTLFIYNDKPAIATVGRWTWKRQNCRLSNCCACGNVIVSGLVSYNSWIWGVRFPVTAGNDLATQYSLASGTIYYRATQREAGAFLDYTGTRVVDTVLSNGWPSAYPASWTMEKYPNVSCLSTLRQCSGSVTNTTQDISLSSVDVCAYSDLVSLGAARLLTASSTTTLSPVKSNSTELSASIPSGVFSTTVDSGDDSITIGFRPNPLIDAIPANNYPGCSFYSQYEFTNPMSLCYIDRIELTHDDASVTVIGGG